MRQDVDSRKRLRDECFSWQMTNGGKPERFQGSFKDHNIFSLDLQTDVLFSWFGVEVCQVFLLKKLLNHFQTSKITVARLFRSLSQPKNDPRMYVQCHTPVVSLEWTPPCWTHLLVCSWTYLQDCLQQHPLLQSNGGSVSAAVPVWARVHHFHILNMDQLMDVEKSKTPVQFSLRH